MLYQLCLRYFDYTEYSPGLHIYVIASFCPVNLL